MEQIPEAIVVTKPELTILPYGTKVKVGGQIPGKITSACITGDSDHVTYEVAYWAGPARCAVWLTEGEIEIAGPPIVRRRVGFEMPKK